MSQIVWDRLQDRRVEFGVDRGVLYPWDGPGVAWNGLVSVTEKVNRTVEPVYFDGVKVNDIVAYEDTSATLSAYTYPDEFAAYDGVQEIEGTGLFVYSQLIPKFHLSYRTLIGTGVDMDYGYKIHLWYNLTASPSTAKRQTLDDDVDPSTFEWTLTSVPIDLGNMMPASHVVIDSTKADPYILADIELSLYGSEDSDPRIPALPTLIASMMS